MPTMKSCHKIKNLYFNGEYMILTIDGEEKDEDIAVDGLLGIVHTRESKRKIA